MPTFKILGKTIKLGKDASSNAPTTDVVKKGTGGDPYTRKRATTVIKKQYKREVSWQISDIKMALIMAANPINPDRLRLHQIYRYIMLDARMKSQVRDMLLKIKSEPWMLYIGDNPDEELTELYRKRWMNAIIQYIAEKELHGYSVLELDKIEPDKINIGMVTLLPREHISIENQWILINATVNGSYIPYGDVMWDIDLLEFVDDRADYGILLECAYNVIWKYYSRTDWSRTSEKWGSPVLSVLVDTTDDKELDNYEARAANFGSDGYIIGQKGDEMEILFPGGTKMHDIFLDNIKMCNEELTILVNGQTAMTDQKAFVGSSEVQERKFEDLTLSRLQTIVDDINEKVIPYLRYKGFKLPEDIRFDYPALVQERARKTIGQQEQPHKELAGSSNEAEPATKPTKDVKTPAKVGGNEQ
jgi:hypothetical protein